MSDGAANAQLARFLVTGVLGAALDLALLTVFVEVGGLQLGAATALALGIACGVHFGLNMRWVFGAEQDTGRRLLRYATMLGLNYAITLGLVLGLTGVGLWYGATKVAALGVCAAVNFASYRHWVFA